MYAVARTSSGFSIPLLLNSCCSRELSHYPENDRIPLLPVAPIQILLE